ncbi:MAG TPA: TetR family transcriptional regulator [Gemmataceae bacterium]|jgi:AcrR family transcriptional regulator|nr:TetR family transcriptional regulator [Gemmataceae bacterium]
MRKGERKRQLLQQARALIAAEGFGAATPERLAEVAEVTPARLARHFPDEATLFRAVLDDIRKDPFAVPAADSQPSDPAGQLQAILDKYLAAGREPTVGFRVLLRALVELTDADRRAELIAVLLECTEPLVRLLQAGQQAGVFRRLDAQVAAWELLQAVIGFALTGQRDVTPAEGEPTPPLDTLLHGVLKTDV